MEEEAQKPTSCGMITDLNGSTNTRTETVERVCFIGDFKMIQSDHTFFYSHLMLSRCNPRMMSNSPAPIVRSLLSGIFKPCHAVVPPEPYFENCVYDMCATGGQTVALCQAIESYADMCAAAGVNIAWRNSTFCRKSSS